MVFDNNRIVIVAAGQNRGGHDVPQDIKNNDSIRNIQFMNTRENR